MVQKKRDKGGQPRSSGEGKSSGQQEQGSSADQKQQNAGSTGSQPKARPKKAEQR